MKKLLTTVIAIGLAAAAAAPALAGYELGPKGKARVRVVHASPDAPPVDILVNGMIRAFTNVKFGDVTPYAALPAGVYDFAVVPTGGGLGSAVKTIPGVNLSYYGDTTVVALNTLDKFEVLPLADANRSIEPLLNPGAARLRFVHASPDAPNVDIKIANGPYLFTNVAFKDVGDYVLVPAGRFDVEVRVAGGDTPVLTVPSLAFRSGATYTAYAIGFAGGAQPKLTAIVSQDVPGSREDRR